MWESEEHLYQFQAMWLAEQLKAGLLQVVIDSTLSKPAWKPRNDPVSFLEFRDTITAGWKRLTWD